LFTFDSRRIAWHLHLQSILKFQKHFLAPRSAIKSKHRQSADNAAENNATRSSAREAELPGIKRFTSPKAGPMKAVRAFLPGISLPIQRMPQTALGHLGASTPSQPRTFSWGVKPLIRNAIVPRNAVSGSRTAAVNETAVRRFRRPEVIAGTASPSLAHQSVAEGSLGATRHANLRSSSLSRRSPFPGGSSEASSLRAPPPPIEAGSEEPRSGDGDRLSNSDMSDASPGDPWGRPHPARASVLHIDGAVLARWTVQYLERALGGPTNGMTGIDPRAGLPRNRVSPF
jgi:hypothetical protein